MNVWTTDPDWIRVIAFFAVVVVFIAGYSFGSYFDRSD